MNILDIVLIDQDGKKQSLADYRGKWVVVYAYPRDDTPGCTKEACGFRDAIAEFAKRGVVVIGVSKDSVASHKKFVQKYHLQFTLLSDPDHRLLEALGAWGKKTFMGRSFEGTLRRTFIFNPTGKIVKTYPNVTPATHASQVLVDLDRLMRDAA